MNIKRRLLTGPLIIVLALLAVQVSWAAESYGGTGSRADSGIVLEAEYGHEGAAKGGRYVPLDVRIFNQESTGLEGSLQILVMESDYEVYRYDYPVFVEAGQEQERHLYIPMGNRSDQMFITVEDQEGQQIAHKRLQLDFSLDVPELFVGILSDTPEALGGWDRVGVNYGMLRTKTMFFDTINFPQDKLGLDMIDVMLITDFRIRDLSEEQSQVLIEWVRSGGVMILGTGARVDDTLGRFAPELLEEMYEEPEYHRIDMSGHYTQEAPGATVFDIPCVEFSLSGGNIILADESRTFLSAVTYRRGIVAVAAYDFVDIGEFCRENPSYLDKLLTGVLGEKRITSLAESVYSGNSGQYWAVRDMLNSGNVKWLPNMGLYTMEIVIYVFLAGVGLYVFLKQRDLTEYYMGGVMALSVLFTVIIWLMGSRTRFKDTFYTYARFLEVNYDTISDTAYLNIQAPYNRAYESHLAPGYWVKPVTQNQYGSGTAGVRRQFTGMEDYAIRADYRQEETLVEIRDVPAFDARYFQMNKVKANNSGIGFEGDIEVDQGRYTGTIISHFEETLENCAVLLYGKLIYLGDMEPEVPYSLDGREVLTYPLNHSYQVAAYLSGQNGFEEADINNDAYMEAVAKTNAMTFYLDNFMPDYSPNAKVIGVFSHKGENETYLLNSGTAMGKTVASADISVYSSEDEVRYRSGLIKKPQVLGGSYDVAGNMLYGGDPVTLEYALGNDVRIEKLLFRQVSPVFTQGGSARDLNLFAGNVYFYNHNTGKFDLMDSMKVVYEKHELAPYLSPGNTFTVKYVYENMTDYSLNVLLPMVELVGRED